MFQRNQVRGFSLIEVLLVLAIIGILSGIAIPSFLGQRQRARRVGDAEANARVLAMALEATKADTGIYGPAGATATWTPGAVAPTLVTYLTSPAPSFSAAGNSQMTFQVTAQPLTYTIDVYEGDGVGGIKWISTNQAGATTVYIK